MAPVSIFNVLPQGGSFVGSAFGAPPHEMRVFQFFHCATPRGVIRWVTVWGTASRNEDISIFHCATPRGLIHWVTFWGNGSLLGLNSIVHCATPRGLIRNTTVWGDGSVLGINSIFHCATPRGLTTLYPPLAEGQAKLCPVLA